MTTTMWQYKLRKIEGHWAPEYAEEVLDNLAKLARARPGNAPPILDYLSR